MKKIALEEHFTRPELSAYGHGPQSSLNSPVFREFEARLLEFDSLRLEAMDEAGIDLAVLSVTTPGVQGEPDANVAIKHAREANDFLAREIRKHPTRYAGYAHLPLHDAKAAADELTRCVEQLGFKGAMINGHTNGRYLDERDYDVFWERVQALDAPIYLHPADLYDMPRMYEGHPELLGATWSWTVETATHALRSCLAARLIGIPKRRSSLATWARRCLICCGVSTAVRSDAGICATAHFNVCIIDNRTSVGMLPSRRGRRVLRERPSRGRRALSRNLETRMSWGVVLPTDRRIQ